MLVMGVRLRDGQEVRQGYTTVGSEPPPRWLRRNFNYLRDWGRFNKGGWLHYLVTLKRIAS